MAASTAYLNAIADAGGALMTHLALVNAAGAELSGGSYARQAVTWGAAVSGLIRPAADKTFSVPAGVTVGGWRAYSALSGGTDYGGDDLVQESFVNAGNYLLLAASTGYQHTAV